MPPFLRFRRGKRDQKRRRSTTSWSPALESLEELILLSPTPRRMTSATSSINVAPAPSPPPSSWSRRAPTSVTATPPWPHRHRREWLGQNRHDLQRSGDPRPVRRDQRAKLGGTLTINAVNGVAAFTRLTINTAGTGYTLTASSGTLTSAKSSITSPPSPPPSSWSRRRPPPASPRRPLRPHRRRQERLGQNPTTYNGSVTLALSGGTSGAKLGGTLTIKAVNGVATFSNLTINTAGTLHAHRLQRHPDRRPASTSPRPSPPPSSWSTTPPSSVTANAPFGLTVTARTARANRHDLHTGG